MSAAAGLAARLAEAALATTERRFDPAPRSTTVAMTCPGGFVMCVKPWAVDAWGSVSEVCSSKPAHHDGPCGPWMPEIGVWNSPPPRDHDGNIVNLDDLDYGLFETPGGAS